MRLEFSDAQVLVREAVERIVGNVAPEDVREHWGTDPMGEVYRTLGAAGFVELFALDGETLSLVEGAVEPCVVMEVLGAKSVLVPLVSSVVLASPFGALAQLDTESLTRGTDLWTAALWSSGPRGALSEREVATCTATTVGSQYAVTGCVPLVEYAHTAENLVVPVARGDECAVAVVPLRAEGVVVTRRASNGGTPLYSVELDAVVVDAARVVCGPQCGRLLDAVRAFGLLVQSAYLLGGAQRALDMSVSHVAEREQFQRPIGSFQTVRHRLADMAIALQGARLLLYECASRFDPALATIAECAEVKAWISSTSADVLRLAHELHGGVGAVDDHELTLLFRRSLSERSLHGAAPVLWDLAGDLLERPFI